MKIAIAHWRGRVSPVFDVSDSLVIIGSGAQGVEKCQTVTLAHRDPLRRSREVADLGVDVLICGAISHALERFLISAGIKVNGFVCGDVDKVAAAYREGRLQEVCFLMPGKRLARNKRRQRHRGGQRPQTPSPFRPRSKEVA